MFPENLKEKKSDFRLAFRLNAIRVLSPLLALACGAIICSSQSPRVVVKNQGYLPFADEPINYRSQDLDDPVAKLQRRLDRGDASLRYDPRRGYLRSVLDELRIPVSSQALVFSKTSFQFPEIAPATPRALYYNDDVYVGRVHGGKFLEFVSFDARQGAIFYVLDEHQVQHPRFERASVDCVQCHVAASTRNVPGVLMRSVFTKTTGYPAAGAHAFVTGHESPIGQRWGGWYVTAARGAESGMGNAVVADPKNPEQIDRAAGANLSSLVGRFNTADYLAPTSDVVSLMVLAHQTQMHNLITQTNYHTRLALFGGTQKKDLTGQTPEVERKKIAGPAEQLVRYLLFTNEAPLDGPITGTSGFAEEFAARGPRDSRGRSLRDFDLRTRIFKYPCSYLIYSEDFDAIPQPAKDYIYRRLFEVLSGSDQSPEFSNLKGEDRQAILEILVATKPGIPNEWKQFLQQTSSSNIRASAGVANRQP
jgi:hypothetical protein